MIDVLQVGILAYIVGGLINFFLPIYLGYSFTTKKWNGFLITLWSGLLFFGITIATTYLLLPYFPDLESIPMFFLQLITLTLSIFIVWKVKDYGIKKFVPYLFWTITAALFIKISGIGALILGWLV